MAKHCKRAPLARIHAADLPGLVREGWSEKEFMAQVVALAKLYGWVVFHPFDSRRSAAGFPDVLMLRGSRQLVAELKVKGRKATAAQQTWLRAFEAALVDAYLWTPDSWAEIEKVLR